MKRSFYLSVGFALGVAATRQTRRAKAAALTAVTPTSIAANIADAISELGHAVGGFVTDVRAGMHQRESELVSVVNHQTGLVSWSPPELAGPYRPRQLRAIDAVARTDRGWRSM